MQLIGWSKMGRPHAPLRQYLCLKGGMSLINYGDAFFPTDIDADEHLSTTFGLAGLMLGGRAALMHHVWNQHASYRY